ncbi:MAG: SemiSWEET transporter [Bacteroidetes bacterium]|nr:SemiSWEET transporter [Bacteroidota bacterium]MBS1974422.1 SemiSWEET transporter [Bacteroidota bacterium]
MIVTSIGLAAAFLTIFSFIPQALHTIRTKNTSGISLYMYSIFTLGTLLWLVYGLFTANIPIIVANGVTLLFSAIILFYKIKYK